MRKIKKTFLFLVFALALSVQIPFISSLETIDCRDVAPVNYETCIGILNSDLSDEEKNLLISNLDYSNKIITWAWEEYPTVIVIESKTIADSYKEFFEFQWKTADR